MCRIDKQLEDPPITDWEDPNKFPDREGQNIYNSSLMSAGWITAACHYVTIWDALCGLTGGARYYVLPDQWVIERGTETNTI